jgi:methylase of polypeptide subunit release factors
MNKLFTKKMTKELVQNRLVILTEKEEYSSIFRIYPLNQYLILIPFRRFCEPQVYIGAESLTFHKYINVLKHPNKILDLATGSGFQLFGLPWQGPNYSMLGVDINPNAIAVATISAQWNDCHWMTFKEGDITKDLNDIPERFDLIIGHLPILPTPENTRYKGTIHNDGGKDGFTVIRKTFQAISDILESDGSFQLILNSLGNKQTPTLISEIEKLFEDNKLKGQVLVIKKIPVELDAYYRGRTSEEYDKWIEFYKKQKKSYWYRLILRAEKNHLSGNGETLSYIELFRTDFSKPPISVSLEKVRRDLNHCLTDVNSLSRVSSSDFNKFSENLEKEITRSENLNKSVSEYGKKLADIFPDIFPNSGSAIRFWGQLTADQWQPKYLERKLW